MTPTQRRKNLRYHILKWHHRIGALISLIILLVASSGLILNHTDDLALDTQKISNPLIRTLYGINIPDNIIQFQSNQHWVTLVGESVFWETQHITTCTALIGFIHFGENYIIACHKQLLLLSEDGEIIETIDEYQGLPASVNAIGTSISKNIAENFTERRLVINTDEKIYAVDLKDLSWDSSSLNGGEQYAWSQTTRQQSPNITAIMLAYTGNNITLERVLLDFHSGRIFGLGGVIANDIFAILLISLALSGFWIWNTRRRKKISYLSHRPND